MSVSIEYTTIEFKTDFWEAIRNHLQLTPDTDYTLKRIRIKDDLFKDDVIHKQLKDKALNVMVEMGARDRKEALEQFKVASDIWQTGIKQDQFKDTLAVSKDELALRRDEFATRREEAQQAAIAAGLKFDLDKYLVTELSMGGDRKKNAEAFMGARYGGSGSGSGPYDKKLQGGTETGTQEGATAKDTSGKSIVFSNGQWVYP